MVNFYNVWKTNKQSFKWNGSIIFHAIPSFFSQLDELLPASVLYVCIVLYAYVIQIDVAVFTLSSVPIIYSSISDISNFNSVFWMEFCCLVQSSYSNNYFSAGDRFILQFQFLYFLFACSFFSPFFSYASKILGVFTRNHKA